MRYDESMKNDLHNLIAQPLDGVFSFSSKIARKKKIFITAEYVNAMLRALKHLEMAWDVCNLGFMILPDGFQWVFKTGNYQDRPQKIYAELKKMAAREILQNLKIEAKHKEFKVLDFFQNKKIGRREPEQILEEFKDEARHYPGKNFRVWQKGGNLKKLPTKLELAQAIEQLKTDRDYPLLFIDEPAFEKIFFNA